MDILKGNGTKLASNAIAGRDIFVVVGLFTILL
jgi:hypothetical protein